MMPKFATGLQSYYRSGWAFLLPYLAAYLLYAWLGWPVNLGTGSGSLVPCLLHTYWVLHAIHVIMAGLALWSWRKHSAFQPFSLSAFYKTIPWLCLGLLFWIPGIYLEWPSDPWEHLRRINEWHTHSLVTEHSVWKKSSYFLPYSLTGFATGLTQLRLLDVYYTAVCLLLSWQYYRLARAVGLSERASFLFVLLNAVTFGNSIFSFYRYYGLSSSIFAQLGAVALTRIALSTLSIRKPETGNRKPEYFPAPPLQVSGFNLLSPLSGLLPPFALRALLFAAATLALLPLIAFTHIQGIGIAGLGIMSVIVWRLIEWKRVMIGWLALATVLASVATVLWFPRHPVLDEVYRPEGWLNAAYGFNLFSPASVAFERSLHILGAFGLLSLVAGFWLIVRRNHFAGWLTLMPVLALALPCFALPFAHVITAQTIPDNIVIFHRFLFAVPMGLAVVAAFSRSGFALKPAAHHDATNPPSSPAALLRDEPRPSRRMTTAKPGLLRTLGQWSLASGIFILLTTSPGTAAYNRLWHSAQVTPDDLALRHFVAMWPPENRTLAQAPGTLTISPPLGTDVQEAFLPSSDWYNFRPIHAAIPVSEIEQQLDWLSVLLPHEWKAARTGAPQIWQIFTRFGRENPSARLHVDFTASDIPWLHLGGSEAVNVFTGEQLHIYNTPGTASHVFNPTLIPIDRSKRYHLASNLRQTGDSTATNYLAVAWYDQDGHLLPSNIPKPEGAGIPVGWSNGTYSYYGLANQPAPTELTTYTITFGLGEPAAIPANAAYLRAGALLNYNSTPEAAVQLANVILQEIPTYDTLLLVAPAVHRLITPVSHAGWLSRHWSTQNVPMKHAGAEELLMPHHY